MQLTEYHREVFIGLLLGDGSLKTNKSKTVAYFKYNQSVIRTGYVFHLFDTLSHYCTHLPNYHVRKYDTDYLQLYSRSLPALLELYEFFYKDGVKILPQCFEDLLTPVIS
ncbi:homing endonuclease [Dichotomocladium elegans]|nr:homing endonuclease [Dichotomocladium elegans]KAI9309767.1 homing endonuclease [Dichotomocladium elegans]